MNQEDIERMVEEAENWAVNELQCVGEYHPDFHTVRDQRFAALVTAAEREACAKVCEETGKEPDDHKSYEGYEEGYQDGSNNCAAAIRARSTP